ncbi:hypothetical protein LR48_Vigan02g051700 [Vigna angularis]|uniref:PB1-like domain-containing protein n=1 Tax=Phaseolus angularis TaxID=3914 RepID=A0A0L9TVC6_PHAAN|nr:hypothetical protein LR48_Vigan02g051700 [Vigna angularis]
MDEERIKVVVHHSGNFVSDDNGNLSFEGERAEWSCDPDLFSYFGIVASVKELGHMDIKELWYGLGEIVEMIDWVGGQVDDEGDVARQVEEVVEDEDVDRSEGILIDVSVHCDIGSSKGNVGEQASTIEPLFFPHELLFFPLELLFFALIKPFLSNLSSLATIETLTSAANASFVLPPPRTLASTLCSITRLRGLETAPPVMPPRWLSPWNPNSFSDSRGDGEEECLTLTVLLAHAHLKRRSSSILLAFTHLVGHQAHLGVLFVKSGFL